MAPRSGAGVRAACGGAGAAGQGHTGRGRPAQGLGRRAEQDPSRTDGAGMAANRRRGEFCRRGLRDRQAPDRRRDGNLRRGQLLQLRAALPADEAGADVPVIGRRRHGCGAADGGGRLPASAGHPGDRLRRRRRGVDDRE